MSHRTWFFPSPLNHQSLVCVWTQSFFLNLWMKDCPFSLDHLSDVVCYIYAYNDSYLTKCDYNSGYYHVCLSDSSQTYVGFEGGCW
jgi:hypothetical protein